MTMPFRALGPTQIITASGTSQPFASMRIATSLKVNNTKGTGDCYIQPYDSSNGVTVATTASDSVAAGTVQIIGSPTSCDAFSIIGAGSVSITPGEGM